MYSITLTEQFTATHSLDTLRPQRHSHDWIVKVVLVSETLMPPGVVVNYYDLKPAVYKLLPHGQHLNDVYPFAPTGENLARCFYEALKPSFPQLFEVSVGEFEALMCTYRPD